MSSKQDESHSPDGSTAAHYAVGYGKPPIRFRFKKGRSGNPKGRPSGHGKAIRMTLKAVLPKVTKSQSRKISKKAGPLATSRGESQDKWSDVTDEEVLQLVRARKLTWQALFALYVDEKEEQVVSKPVGSAVKRRRT